MSASADDTRGALLEDASGRVSLFSSAAKSNALEIVSSDGSAKVKAIGQMQFRHVFSHRNGSGIDQDQAGFEFRRLRTGLSGSLQNGKVPFYIVAEADRKSTLNLNDAWFGYKADNGDRFRIGQFAPGFTREQLVSSKRRLSSDNTVAHSSFDFGRSQGVDWQRTSGDWKIFVFVGDGPGEKNTRFTMDSDYGATARVQRKFGEGDWKRHDDFIGKPGDTTAYLVGAGVSIAGGEIDADVDGMRDDDFYDLRYTADAGVEGDGWNAFVAFFGQQFDAQTMSEVNTYGVTLQGGAFVTEDIDLFVQYAWADDDADNGELSILTAGFNKYIHGHNIKFTVDANFALEPVTSTFSSGSRGTLVDAMGEDGQFFIRSQIQLLF